MSEHSTTSISCPQCGKKISFLKWESINTALDPSMKKKVLTGEAFAFICPKCGYQTTVDYSFLYHQMEDGFMIYKLCEDQAIDSVTRELLEMNSQPPMSEKGYKMRIVRTNDDLKEKIFIFDAGLDDRVIEIYKMVIRSKISQENPGFEYDSIRFSGGEDGSNLLLLRGGSVVASVPIDDDTYRSFAETFADKIEAASKDVLIIDGMWIANLL